jgi:hypothetical protein
MKKCRHYHFNALAVVLREPRIDHIQRIHYILRQRSDSQHPYTEIVLFSMKRLLLTSEIATSFLSRLRTVRFEQTIGEILLRLVLPYLELKSV